MRKRDIEKRAAPSQVRLPGGAIGRRRDDCHALHRPLAVVADEPGEPDELPDGTLCVLGQGSVVVVAGAPRLVPRAASREKLGPVYELAGGTLAVPTGLVFVRFATDESAAAHEAGLNAAGFEIVESPPYAPHAAWLRSRQGEIGRALHGIAKLETLEGVLSVEPQLLVEVARRR